ncbi:hypothetical protein BV25DRAFT_1890725 [Artomyces pyxidatus]|uniref:Uncharacterized protein n=1 Tax=Artomyces pyxidatus TaxID=48021 RepID=A0ACB8SR57_9AGAM|nr:hypothetical protein BV25DRAFT_1890725 [Artomyces pyxidatus]
MEAVPADILLEIAAYLHSPAQVLPLSLTSKRIFQDLIPALYANITLRDAPQCVHTLDMLFAHPDRARHIRTLCVRPDAQEGPPRRPVWGRKVLQDGYSVSAAVRRTAMYLEVLRSFIWDGEELPPYDDMWFALRVFCPSLRFIGSTLGSILPSPNSHLFDFSNLHGFSLVFKSGFYWQYEGLTREEAVPGYHRLWDMLSKRCPDLQELIIDGFAPHEPVDAHRLTRGRWHSLRKLVLGDIVMDWHASINSNSRRPFLAFLEEHRSLETLHLLGHEQSVAAPSIFADLHAEALPRVTEFYGSLEQVQAFQHKHAIRKLNAPDAILLREATPLSVSGVLSAMPYLSSLTIVFRLEHGYDNGGILRAIVAACPHLEHLDFTCACKPSFTIDTFSRAIRPLGKLRTLILRIVKAPAEDSLTICGTRIARTNPRLQTFTLEFLARSVAPPTRGSPALVLERASFELAADHHGLPVTLRMKEHRRKALWRRGTSIRHRMIELRPIGYPGTHRSGIGMLLIERSPAGEEARLICFCVVLFIAAIWGCLAF